MTSGTVAGDELRLFVERIENLETEKKGIADDIKDVFAEAKAQGFDTWAIKAVIKLRRLETHTLQERDAILNAYIEAVGMTPIEHAIAMAA
jgi:uncharacterized protein (UPF0335 family)